MAGRKPVRLRRMTTALSRLRGAAVARIALWNALAFAAASCAVVASAELYLRLTWPFPSSTHVAELVPGVGVRFKPHSEVRSTNTLDWWTVQRANSIGFLDREPLSPQRAAASCHVAVVGDSYVEANQVQVSDKLQVRLERMAAERLPGRDVTVSAYGFRDTGQVAQLPWWDEWIRRRPPKLVVLVFVPNDFYNNGRSRRVGDWPYAYARTAQDGSRELVLPGARVSLPDYYEEVVEWTGHEAILPGARVSLPFYSPRQPRSHVETWVRRRLPIWRAKLWQAFPSRNRPGPFFEWTQRDRIFTAFAFDEWKERVHGEGASLVVLSGHDAAPSHARTRSMLDDMKRLAFERDIPVIDQLDHILLRGGNPRDAHFASDSHWTPQGHQWAAEALLEWLAANPSVCDG